MKIGIDVSQTAYENTGVANYLANLVQHLLVNDTENEYILFFSSMRRKFPRSNFQVLNKSQRPSSKVTIREYFLPSTVLSFLWNTLHIAPIEWFIGDVDIFITSDWTEPPTKKAKKMTVLYDLIVYKYPEETAASIVSTQKKKLKWMKKESSKIICISESTKKDAEKILGIDESKLKVIYPGL